LFQREASQREPVIHGPEMPVETQPPRLRLGGPGGIGGLGQAAVLQPRHRPRPRHQHQLDQLRREYPERVAVLHQRAARWYGRNGLLTLAVRHAARAGDWQLAATMIIDDLAISQIIEPGTGQRLAGDRAQGRRALAAALRLAEPEQLRLPFVLERSWISPVLQQDLELAAAYRRLFPAPGGARLPATAIGLDQVPALPAEPLSDREREVLRHISGMLSTAEVASAMYISVNTVKTHLRTICRKLATDRRGEAVRRARQLELI
jgi:ATP/maltotriose-dependent transcriptional regulator MalT